MAAPGIDTQLAEVWSQLELVMDPELDEPLTDLGFIEAVSITDHAGANSCTVAVDWRLPTYWCSPNFAFLMAEGIRDTVLALPWVGQVAVNLQDHMSADEMNAAINSGAAFGTVFEGLQPGEDLAALRESFDKKAFQRRQEVVIKALIAQGHDRTAVPGLTYGTLLATQFEDIEDERQRRRYLDLLTKKELARDASDPGLPMWDGNPIGDDLQVYMGLLRSVRINMEFSSSLCRGLKSTRYQVADLTGDVPMLVNLPLPERGMGA